MRTGSTRAARPPPPGPGLRVPRPRAPRLDAVGEPARAGPRREADRGLQQRALDLLAPSGPLALVERGQHALGAPPAGAQLADWKAPPGGRPVGLAGDVHDAPHALGDEIEAALLAIGPVGAEAGELRVDEPRIGGAERLPAEPGAVHHRRAVVLHEHVGGDDQLREDLAAARALVVEGEALLVAVDVAEVRVALAAVAHAARGVARARALQLDHLGSHVGQDHGAEGPRHVLGQVEHLHAVEWSPRGRLSHAISRLPRCRARGPGRGPPRSCRTRSRAGPPLRPRSGWGARRAPRPPPPTPRRWRRDSSRTRRAIVRRSGARAWR